MDGVLTKMQNKGLSIFLGSYSALDRYFQIKEPGPVHILTDASLVSLAQIFDALQFTGMPFEDACLVEKDRRYVFRLADRIEHVPPRAFTAQYLVYNLSRDAFLDPRGIYRDLRQSRLVEVNKPISNWTAVMEAAKMVARYHYEIILPQTAFGLDETEPTPGTQRELLECLLTSRYTEKGMTLLHKAGFIERFWPELFEMASVQHSKEYHPEGDVWEHTLESLRHRKKRDITLSMALLLHDIGKPISAKLKDKPFKDHAELGTRIGASFLRFLGYDRKFISEVNFLIRYHMLPSALKKLPLYRTERLMDSDLFPQLLELYRADIESSYRGPDSYYEACRVYKTYLKKKKNPYVRLNRSKKLP